MDALYGIYGFDCFSNQTEVLVLDISRILNKRFSDSIAAPSTLKNVRKVGTLRQLVAELREVRKSSCDGGVCVNYLVPSQSLISVFINFICFFQLRNSEVKVLTSINYGMPTFKENKRSKLLSAGGNHGFSLGNFLKKVYSFFCARLPSPMSSLVTHTLVAGKNFEVQGSTENIEIIKGHCHNYERYLFSGNQAITVKLTDTIVFLDAPGPLFRGDYTLSGNKVHKTIDVWYPSLCHFFDRLEERYDAKVVIAAHYKSDISTLSDYFGGREVFSGCTNKLISESKLVVTEQSSAVAFAVIYKKPIFFVYSDELKEDVFVMRFSDNMAKLLGQMKINANQIDSIPSVIPQINESAYQNYKDQFLTSDPTGQTNAQLIESKILGL